MLGDVNILIVDDDIKIADLLKIHFLSMGNVYCRTVCSAEEGLSFLGKDEFHLVVADFRMPGTNGLEFLKRVRDDYPEIIKVLFTGFGDLNAIQQKLIEGEIAYFISKPWQQAQLRIVLDAVKKDLTAKSQIRHLKRDLKLARTESENLQEQLYKNTKGTVLMLREVLKTLSPKVASHCRRTALLAKNLAQRMQLDHESILILEWAALLHDFALSTAADQVQDGIEVYLSSAQKELLKTHPVETADALEKLGPFKNVAQIIRVHHENIDGSGFYGFTTNDIPIEARILRVCDFFDEEASYNRNAHMDVLDFMRMYKGKWFDKSCLDEFYDMVKALKK